MKKRALKYLTVALALIFFSASVYCAVESFTTTLAHLGTSHHHEKGTAPHDHAAPVRSQGHHHGDPTSRAPEAQGTDFCCSQLNGIPVKLHDLKPLERNLFFAAEKSVVAQTDNLILCNGYGWFLHDKAPPAGLHSTLFYVLNFPTHAPPLSLPC